MQFRRAGGINSASKPAIRASCGVITESEMALLMPIESSMKLNPFMGILFLCVLTYSCASKYNSDMDNTGDYVSLKNGKLGWSGVFVSESRRDLEKQLGNDFEVHRQAFPTCGQYASRLVLDERTMTLEWSAASSDATIDAIYVNLPVDEHTLPAASIAEQITNRLPQLAWEANNRDFSKLNYHDKDLILIKSGNDNFLLISLATCLD